MSSQHRPQSRRSVLTLLLMVAAGGWIGWGTQPPQATAVGATPAEAGERSFTVAAASDLQYAFNEIGRVFEKQTGSKVVFSFGSTGNLAKQIEHGAPFDLFAAANEAYVDGLDRKGLVLHDSKRLYALGRIVVASNKQFGLDVKDLGGLVDARIKRIAIANPDHAPYGMAAREALMKAGTWDDLRPKLVYGESIRQALQFVQSGNAEVGIVALSVARVPEVEYHLIDSRLHAPLRQAIAVVKGTRHDSTGRKFIAFINGPVGRPIMRKYGFQSPGKY